MQAHAAICLPCAELLGGIGGVRHALQDLSSYAPSPLFSLHLPGQLQTRLESRLRKKARSVALGLAAGAALAILLWPESPAMAPAPEGRVAQWSESETRQEWRQMWSQRLPLSEAGPHSHARVRLASF